MNAAYDGGHLDEVVCPLRPHGVQAFTVRVRHEGIVVCTLRHARECR